MRDNLGYLRLLNFTSASAKIRVLLTTTFVSLTLIICASHTGGYNIDDSYIISIEAADTIPLKDRHGDFINDDTYNPFDITPSIITQEVEYDPETGNYIILEKIGDEYYRTPSYMTFEEYMDWRAEQQEREYFAKLAGINTGIKSSSGKVDPMARIDVEKNLVDRLFGGTEVDIQPQGNIDLTFGLDYQKIDNPTIPVRQQRQGPFLDFDMDIQMNVDGQIGEKLKLGFNYDTQATFDFDRKIKLEYDTEAFSEDDIIKKLEAGNVSMPLKGQLIQGSQNLFGLKTELQFGRLRVTGLASQQKSKQEELVIEGGSLVQEFEIRPDEYDENRHFFLSHYHRDNFERALANLPNINSQFRISRIQVWITGDRDINVENTSMICALSDIAESDPSKYTQDNPVFTPTFGLGAEFRSVNSDTLPDNRVNGLYDLLVNDEPTRNIVNAATNLRTVYQMNQTRDFEIFRGRKLSQGEFTYHPELGIISLNVRLRPNQVLAVAYEFNYTYNGETVYKVGELTEDGSASNLDEMENVQPDNLLYTKMLKSTNQRVSLPQWDLMMKNVYPLGTAQVNQEDFQFDIFFEDNTDGSLKRFLPEPGFKRKPLLDVFNLDRLNSQLDPQQDGIFDFVPGITIIPRSGSVIFPVLEPFGKSLNDLLGPALADKYDFQELYDSTLTASRELLHKNRFVLKGKYKSSISSDISLGTFNIPQGSVTVRAGGVILKEGIDYEIDYGIGRLRIINDAYLQSGTPIRVSFEDNSVFSLQQKTMFGLRAEYEFSKNLTMGATYIRLFERPFTKKVNLGDDPINNRIFGLDLNYSTESDFITKAIDKLPFYSTKEKSSLSFSTELAAIKPGHSGAINLPDEDVGVVSIDDFEGAGSSIPLGTQTNQWVLASTPPAFPESQLADNHEYGKNRAKLSWYQIDNTARRGGDVASPYASNVDPDRLFGRQTPQNQFRSLFTFDLSYFPDERGPYNFDTENSYWDESSRTIKLENPEDRWGGIMRYLTNNDFEASNVEYIEFWLLNPYIDPSTHETDEEGYLYFQFGNVSEDILKDNLQFFESSISVDPTEMLPEAETVWGKIPLRNPINNGLVADQNGGSAQDVGYDGLTNAEEALFFEDYIQEMVMNRDVPADEIGADPAGDDWKYFNDDSYINETSLVQRYKNYSNPHGNRPDGNNEERGGQPFGEGEDLNNNKSLEQGESYYEFEVPIFHNGSGEIDVTSNQYIRQEKEVDGNKWYRFQIPIVSGRAVGGIEGLRSIQFARMYLTGFSKPKTMRFAELELVRNQWRRLDPTCRAGDVGPEFSIDDVSFQEHSSKEPFNYVKPRGIVQEEYFNSFSNILQDEKALSLQFCGLGDSCEISVYKLTQLDLRVFENMQMFVHAEDHQNNMVDRDLSVFLRVGKDFRNNYYEYEIPLVVSDFTLMGAEAEDIVWPENNMFDFSLKEFTELKKERNIQGTPREIYTRGIDRDGDGEDDAFVKIKGNPSLGYVKGIQVGVREIGPSVNDTYCGEVWINELRVSGLQERGGWAGLARMEMKLADLGDFTAAGGYSSIGFGTLDQKLDERSKDEIIDYDLATNLQLGKFFPNSWGLQIPFYAQYAKSIKNPEFDPYELDLTVAEAKESASNPSDVDERAQDVTTIKTFNFVNVKKGSGGGSKNNKGSGKKSGSPKPWSISNISASYSFTEINHHDPLIKKDQTRDQKLGLDYNYSTKPLYIQPFKGLKGGSMKWLKEFNFNFIPNSFSFNTQVRRLQNQREFRLPEDPIFAFNDQRFDWERKYALQWDLTKSLKLNFNASNTSVIDELRQVGIADTPDQREWVDERGDTVTSRVRDDSKYVGEYWKDKFKSGGRNKNYNHQLKLVYSVPFKHIPVLDWMSVKAQYIADYGWSAAPLSLDTLGNVIQNGQQRSINATFSFDKLYKKSGYLSSIQSGKSKKSKRKRKRTSVKGADEAIRALEKDGTKKDEKEGAGKEDRKKGNEGPSTLERVLIKPLMALKSIRFTYKEDLSTVVPGFTQDPQYLGLSNGFKAPGWAFAAGLQPNITYGDENNWLFDAAGRQWITDNRFLNQQVSQNKNQTFDLKVALEPFDDLKIDLDFKKSYRKDHSEDFKFFVDQTNGQAGFNQLALTDVGSFDMTFFALNTLFGTDINELFDVFSTNRKIISERLPNISDPPAPHAEETGYSQGYGGKSTSVIVPAFIAAYTGEDANQISLDLEADVRKSTYFPKPNWTLNYNGLNKLPWFKDVFSSFSITHGYKSTLRVNNFFTEQEYDIASPFDSLKVTDQNYYSRLEFPQVVIDEQFAPIIGLKMKTVNDIDLRFEWKKARNLALEIAQDPAQLKETNTKEYTLGFGYTLQGINIGFLTGDKGKKNKRKRRDQEDEAEEDEQDKNGGNRRGGKVSSTRGRTLTISFDMSYRDDVSYIHKLDGGANAQPDRGLKSLRLSPSVDYDVNENFSLRAFVEYNQTKPYLTTSFPITSIRGGLTARFNLN